jgi:hypothetical protein
MFTDIAYKKDELKSLNIDSSGCVALCNSLSVNIDRGLNTSNSSFADCIEQNTKLDSKEKIQLNYFKNLGSAMGSNLKVVKPRGNIIVYGYCIAAIY